MHEARKDDKPSPQCYNISGETVKRKASAPKFDNEWLTAEAKMFAGAGAAIGSASRERYTDTWRAGIENRYGPSESKFLVARAAPRKIEGIPGPDGESIANSASLLKMRAVCQLPGLNDKQLAYLFEACGEGKKEIGFNPGKVEQEIDKLKSRLRRKHACT